MNPEDRRYFDLEFKKLETLINKIIRTQAILLTRTTPQLGE